jgi:hypothetical protein
VPVTMPGEAEQEGPALDVSTLVGVLDRHGVEVLVVGGVAALAYGARRGTRDLDCLVRCEEQNLERLAAAMRELGARLRVEGLSDEEAKAMPLPLDGRWLRDRELSTWRTNAGDFDVLTNLPGRDGRRLSYEELAGRAVVVEATGVIITAAGIDDVIASKEWANRPKDHDALKELRDLSAQRHASQVRPAVPPAGPVVGHTGPAHDPRLRRSPRHPPEPERGR